MVEVMVALTLFAMALGGMFPVLIAYSRQIHRLEKCGAQSGYVKLSTTGNTSTWTFGTDTIYHSQATGTNEDGAYRYTKLPSHPFNQYAYPDQWNLMPADDPWMWKLGASAVLVPDKPSALPGTHTPYLRPFPFTTSATTGSTTWILDDSNIAAVTAGSYTETSGAWMAGPVTGYLTTSRRQASTGSDPKWAATWSFANVQPGWYQVRASWPDPTVTPKPPDPNDKALTNVMYCILDGSGGSITGSPALGIDQTDTMPDVIENGINWYTLTWGTATVAPRDTWIYIPLRDVPGNYTLTTDQNGHQASVYKGDTIQVQIQVPAEATHGFVTADGMRLVPKARNTIKRPAPLAWTWTVSSGQPVRTVAGTVTLSNSDLP
jgi:hypothetical protein